MRKERKSAAAPRSKRPERTAGVVGMGLMGRSIVACILASGDRVVGITSDPSKIRTTRRQVQALLREMRKEGLLRSDPAAVVERLEVTTDYSALAPAGIVVESIIENIDAKREVFRRVEDAVAPKTLIGSNTSAIPVSLLQQGTRRPERFLGLHWAEPAHITQFMEIICGAQTKPVYARRAVELALGWGKEPTLVRRDIRGFITNRVMYAMMREAFYLVESGVATVEDVDRSVRNDLGSWITLAGPFRFMDLTGIPAYGSVMKDLFPELSNSTELPALMQTMLRTGARGVANAKGFYRYTPEEAEAWEKKFLRFSYDIRRLARKYSEKS